MTALLKNYSRKKISFVKGKGCYLYSSRGQKYLEVQKWKYFGFWTISKAKKWKQKWFLEMQIEF